MLYRRNSIIVDDGFATGATMRAAVAAIGRRRPARVVVAVPVGPAGMASGWDGRVDEVVCALTPERFSAVYQGYDDFSQTSDEQVLAALARDWAPALLPGHPVDVLPVVTLRPRHGLPMTLHRRGR